MHQFLSEILSQKNFKIYFLKLQVIAYLGLPAEKFHIVSNSTQMKISII